MATTRDITYEADGRTMIGTLALPDDAAGAPGDRRPGVLVCHEGPGLDDHARERARRIADELGYVAFALDYNGDGKSDLLWRDNSSGNNAVWLMNGTALMSALGIANVPTIWSVQSVNAE